VVKDAERKKLGKDERPKFENPFLKPGKEAGPLRKFYFKSRR